MNARQSRELARVCAAVPPVVLAEARARAEAGSQLADALGAAYEASLCDRGGRRRAGAYYTPAHLVDFVIDRTLGPLLRRRSAAEALGMRVIDPACGGGVFLLAALRRLEAHCVRRGRRPGRALRRAIVERCLAGADVDPGAVAVCRSALALASGGGRAEVRRADSLAHGALAEGAFDAVVGNPPWGQKRFRFPAAAREDLRARYRTARGVLDPFKLFVELAHRIVRPGGRWGLVLPDIVLLKDQQPVRDLMLEESALEWIVDCGRAFAGVNLDAVVVTGRRLGRRPGPRHQVSIWHRLPENWRRARPETRRIRQAIFSELPGHKLNLHLDEEALALLRGLAPLPRLGERFEIHEGVHTGNARDKLFLAHRRNRHSVPIAVGRGEIAPYRLRWAGRWLDLTPGLLDRDAGDYANLGRPAWHLCKKIVVRRTGDRVLAAYDPRGLYVSNNLFVVIPRRTMTAREMRAHVALLNSALMTRYFRTVQPRTGRLFAELKIQHLRDFPLPPAAAWTTATIERLATESRRRERGGASAPWLDPLISQLYLGGQAPVSSPPSSQAKTTKPRNPR